MTKMTLKVKGQWPPLSIPAECIPRCMFGANLVNPGQIDEELSLAQAKFPRILSQNCQNDLEGQCQWSLYSAAAESIPWCMFGANLSIPAQIWDELGGQAKVYGQTDEGTDGQTQQRQYPFGLKRRVKCNFRSCFTYWYLQIVLW